MVVILCYVFLILQYLPPSGITVFADLLHTHLVGKK